LAKVWENVPTNQWAFWMLQSPIYQD
jgi:hypothetical protein